MEMDCQHAPRYKVRSTAISRESVDENRGGLLTARGMELGIRGSRNVYVL